MSFQLFYYKIGFSLRNLKFINSIPRELKVCLHSKGFGMEILKMHLR